MSLLGYLWGAPEDTDGGVRDEEDDTSWNEGETSGIKDVQTPGRKSPPSADRPLEILHEDKDAYVDIVGVHGLAAKPDYAWIWRPQNNRPGAGYPQRPFNWLKELLPTESKCRVVTFNYNSQWMSNAPQQRASSISDELIASLQYMRESTKVGGA
ncbi:hypothetical protein QQS21_005163 [Conoideocrella luteorostrata]|uniref:Uncharacterized protein n=1 Tax=Conoideocrella luteorostrata TaxID=1105319 RepID=A0AAJ0G136_9HYPO|nr:hypothetical protein QQS21_005163 [Conoideocrella luteorostrata]